LCNRKLQVKIGNTFSQPFPVLHGVPQGSVLSLTLFLIFINDIFATCFVNVKYSLFADDCAIWTAGADVSMAIALLQQAINGILTWAQKWGLSLAPDKSKAIIFTSRRIKHPTPLTMYGTSIEYVSSHKFLGIHLDRQLTFRNHIKNLRDRSMRDMRTLRVASAQHWGADYDTLKTLYESLILSKLEYGSFLFHAAVPSTLLILDRI
jgi:hypothetical protein